jgi:cytochrome c biogenesis factor
VLTEFGALALALGALLGAWSVVSAVAAFQTGRDDLVRTADRGAVAATTCAVIATLALAVAAIGADFSVRFVAERTSILMPARYLVVSLLSAGGGALPAFASVAGILGLWAARDPAGSVSSRAWTVGVVGGAVGAALVTAALIMPFDAVVGGHSDGAGLAPRLQRGAVVLQALSLLAASGFMLWSFVRTVGAVASRKVDDAWSRAIRLPNVLAFLFAFIGLVASARVFQLDPVRGPWLAERSTTLWILATAVLAWLVQLDRARQGAERVVMRVLLSGAALVATTGAVALNGGGFVSAPGVVTHPDAAWFAIAPAGAMVVLVSLLRSGKGALADARTVTTTPPNPVAAWLIRGGVILLSGAAIGSAFLRAHSVQLGDTEIFRVKDPLGHQWTFRSQGVSTLRRENFASFTLSVVPERDSLRLPMISAEARSYLLADESDAAPPLMVSGRHAAPFMDTRIAILEPDGRRPTIAITFVPLATWLVPGAILFCAGLLALTMPAREARA